ncbi:MAG: 1-acyl-sn-glycerol-3-phosphate acyltransferase [Nitriliruptoraceae bacterium]
MELSRTRVRPLRAVLDRALTGLARLALRGFYRRLEVTGEDHLPVDRPTLVVANHFNALLDAVLVMHAVGRLPRFVAKSALWRPVWARPLLWLAGMVPVERPQDDGDTARNRSVFASCAEQLARGNTVALFPEGHLAPTPALRPLRTGAARIALNARLAGAEGLVILPLGLVYEDTVALRSRALVRIGPPIDVDRFLTERGSPDADPEDQAAVRSLTTEIGRRLRVLAPDYEDQLEAATLGRAADIALRGEEQLPTEEVPLSTREALARELAQAPEDDQREIIDRLARYELSCSLAGLRDTEVIAEHGPSTLTRLLAITSLRLLLLAPFALAGAIINALPYWAVHWTGRFVRNPALRASARLLTGVALFPPTWLLIAWLMPWNSWWARALVIAAAPVLGLIAVRALERAVEVSRAWHGWVTRLERQEHLAMLREQRRALTDLIDRHRAA